MIFEWAMGFMRLTKWRGYGLGGAAILALGVTTATARTIHVDASESTVRALPSLAEVPWANLKPGDDVVVHAGTYPDVVVITGQGASGNPIRIHAVGGTAPVIENSIVLEGARNIVIDGLTVRDAENSGFILRRGAEAITISGSKVEHSGLGVWIGDGAKGRHRILNNTLNDNQTHGVAIDLVNTAPGEESVISGNRIFRNGMHGVEINGNGYIIEKNTVFENGQTLSGTSNIHLFARTPNQDAGKHNVIRYNITYGEKDDSGQDGNGIQLDQWCDDNEVYFNVSFRNDGAGIAVFDAARNKIYNNTLFDNMIDPGHSHAYRGELVMASDYTKNVNHSTKNLIANNIVVARRPENVAIYVDRLSSGNPNVIGGNVLFHQDPAGQLFFWKDSRGRDISDWNKRKKGDPDIAVDPTFRNPGRPTENGLRPGMNSRLPKTGKSVEGAVMADLTGKSLKKLPFGAYAEETQ